MVRVVVANEKRKIKEIHDKNKDIHSISLFFVGCFTIDLILGCLFFFW